MTFEINLHPHALLLEPTQVASSFTTEQKKYERKSVAIVRKVGQDIGEYDKWLKSVQEGDTVAYSDSDSIDFALDGVPLSIVEEDSIYAVIKEKKNNG